MKKPVWILLLSIFLFSCGSDKSEKKETQLTSPDTITQTVVITDSFPSYTEGEIKWGDTLNGLQMGLAAKADTVYFYYKNCSKRNICMWSFTNGYGLTWNSVALINRYGDTTKMEFDNGDREHAGIAETVCITPGNISAVKECLREWITFRAGQKQIPELTDGKYKLIGFYNGDRPPQDVVRDEHKKTIHWSGKLRTPMVVFTYQIKSVTNNQVKATFN